jgi:hypothetical protein
MFWGIDGGSGGVGGVTFWGIDGGGGVGGVTFWGIDGGGDGGGDVIVHKNTVGVSP